MVWSPSEMPLNKIQDYYPGDNYVDWVGISIYSAQFENGDSSKPTDTNNPLDQAQIIRYKSKTRKRFCSALIIALILEFIGMNNMSATVVTALFLISVMLAVGAIIEKVCV